MTIAQINNVKEGFITISGFFLPIHSLGILGILDLWVESYY